LKLAAGFTVLGGCQNLKPVFWHRQLSLSFSAVWIFLKSFSFWLLFSGFSVSHFLQMALFSPTISAAFLRAQQF